MAAALVRVVVLGVVMVPGVVVAADYCACIRPLRTIVVLNSTTATCVGSARNIVSMRVLYSPSQKICNIALELIK
jgi:hypothetical protein